jgi:hypothetical protein
MSSFCVFRRDSAVWSSSVSGILCRGNIKHPEDDHVKVFGFRAICERYFIFKCETDSLGQPVTLSTCIWKVLGSNFSRDTEYRNCGVPWSSHALRVNCTGALPLLGHSLLITTYFHS